MLFGSSSRRQLLSHAMESGFKKVECKLCDQQLTDGRGMTNLMSHLKAKHSKEYEQITDSSNCSTSKQTTVELVFSLHKTFTLEILEGPNYRDSFEAQNKNSTNFIIR